MKQPSMDGFFYCSNNNATQVLVMEDWFPTCHRLSCDQLCLRPLQQTPREQQSEIH